MTKTKSRHHKSENTHRFLTLSERLSNINVDVAKRINRNLDTSKPEETETYFYQALEKWVDLNYTASFYEFTVKVKRNCQTLALLIYHKENLIQTIVEFIRLADPLSIQPILDLTVQLSRDLQNDFYQYFPRIFESITKLLDTQDTNVLEWSFQTLSYLFKFLWRYMLKDLDNIYNLYSPLFDDSRKEYIRNFAAESFAFLMRKIINKNELFDFLIKRLKTNPEETNGIGQLIFEMFKGIQNQFNACTEHSFIILLEKLRYFEKDIHANELVFNCMSKTVESMAEYTKKQHTNVIWKCFYASIGKFIENHQLDKLLDLMKLILLFLKPKNCYLIDNLDEFNDYLCKIASIDFKVTDDKEIVLKLTECFMDISELMLLSENVKFSIEKVNILPNKLYQVKFDCELICKMTKNLFSHSLFETIILPNVINYFNHHVSGESSNTHLYEKSFIHLLSDYLQSQKHLIEIDSGLNLIESTLEQNLFNAILSQKNLTQFMRLFEEKSLFKCSKLNVKLLEFILNEDKIKSNILNNQFDPILTELPLVVPFLFQNETKIINLMQNMVSFLIEQINTDLNTNIDVQMVKTIFDNLEKKTLLLSLNAWSTLMIKKQEKKLNELINSICNLLSGLGKLKLFVKEKTNNKYDQVLPDKSDNHLLRTLNYYVVLAGVDSNIEAKKSIESIIHLLKNRLSSPYHETRLNTLSILNQYFKISTSSKLVISDEKPFESLFEICLKAEQTPASLDDYRQKLYYLQLLEANVCAKYFNNDEIQNQDVPLRFFFGCLYENFKLIWEPVIALIQSYASNMKMNDFWNVFSEHLVELSDKIESKFYLFKNDLTVNLDDEKFDNLAHLRFGNESNIDHMNNRYLSCKAMHGFANSCESKTRIIVPLFFRFMNNEYYAEENRLLSTAYEDLTQEKFFKDRTTNQKSSKETYFNRALLNKHLCVYLELFSKFTSPKSWYQEENLRNLYLNLLCHHDSNVQKSALSCLYTYNYAYLKPYKDHLEKLLDGKHFRHELVVFSLDENTGIIHADHRVKLLPILMRILYGKFHSHETTHTSSRDTRSNKRATIMQFLSSCSEYELNYFFNLIFDSLNTISGINDMVPNLSVHNCSEDTVIVEDQAQDRFEINDNKFDAVTKDSLLARLQIKLNDRYSDKSIFKLEKVIPLKKILGILQSLEIIIKKLGRSMEIFAHRILQMLCFIHKYSFTLNEMIFNEKIALSNGVSKMKPISEHHVNLLKIIRQKVTIRFKEFFDTFDHLNFTQQEYFFVFDSFLWPQSIKTPNESLKSPNNLLKIFLLWSERSIYYPLFVIKLNDFNQVDSNLIKTILNNKNEKSSSELIIFKSKNILDILFELIDSDKCSQVVVDYVLDIVHNLVTFADFKKEPLQEHQIDSKEMFSTNVQPLPFDVKSFKSDNLTFNELNFGTLILKPYVSSIINHIEKIVILNMSKKTLPAKPLKILARLSCFASNSQQQCEKIIQLLVPYLIKNRKQTEENEINILNSINHLIKQVGNVGDFICLFSRLFCVLKNRQSRVELCNIFNSINEIDSNYSFIAKLVSNLNAWDSKRIEEPDYMLRLEGFKQLNLMIKDWPCFDIKLASILIYNCFFFINNVEDLAIKESSTNCLQLFLKKSASFELKKSEKALFESSFVSEIKNGLRNKSESARHEYINVLVEFIRSFKETFPAYNDLHVLFDNEDAEKDFYENIKHIQMHRRSRALKRLQRACNDNLISSNNLLSFMMPIVRSFLDNDMYHKYDYLIEEACGSIGAICYVLSWPKYLKVVEYYIKILPKNILNQKLIIKILVSVLDAFHYDLSLSKQYDYFTERKKANEPEEGDDDDEPKDDEAKVLTEQALISTDVVHRKKKLVNSSMATKIHSTITKSILPMLFKCLTKRLKSDDQIKINKREDEDEQILRVPMALAILKLLNNLPPKTLETHLPGLLFKVCDMLKSRAVSVRNTTRECLMKMINALPDKKYYFYVFKELSNSLLRGYQVHVLCYTIQMILKNVQEKLVVGDLDSSLSVLMSSVHLELFTDVSEEKEVKQILAKLPEAKTTSSFNTLEMLGKYVSQHYLLDMIKPFKTQLDECNSRKLLKKIEESMKRLLMGLLNNTSLSTQNLMYLIYGLVNDTFTVLASNAGKLKGKKLSKKGEEDKDDASSKSLLTQESCLIISSEPKRGGDKPKVQSHTNQHVIVEFALQLMHHLIKQNRLVSSASSTVNYAEMLDPYLPIFVEFLNGKYLKVTIITLRCLIGFLKFSLPSLKVYSKSIAEKLFALLRTYSGASTNAISSSERGDNFELLMICYKVISTLIRDCTHFSLSDEQLQILMHYAERNLYDSFKQSSAFNLLKSILSRKLQCEELNDILGKVMKLSIQADSLNVRLQSRQTLLQYMLEYSLPEKKLIKLLEFYIVQLNYEYENGRESALEMLATIFNTFPIAQLNEHAAMFYLPLAIQLHNDESPKCKKLASLAIKSLLEKISIEEKDSLFKITMALLNDQEKQLHKRIAALLIKIFVDVETAQFERRLDMIMPVLMTELDAKNFKQNIENNTSSLITEKFFDQYLYNLLTLFMKILSECKIFQDKKYTKSINIIYDQIQIYLTHEHLWVQLVSCQLFGFLFSNYTADEFFTNKQSYLNSETSNSYLKLRDLIDSFCIQLKSPILEEKLAEQIIKNLAFMAKVLNKHEYIEDKNVESASDIKHDMNIEWLIKKVLKEAKYELVNKPKETIKRTFIFKWLAALALELGQTKLKDYLKFMIPILQREILVEETDENLKRLAQEVLDFIKQTIGTEEFSMIYSKSNSKRIENKEERKRKLAQTAIIDPQLAAMKKIRKMQRKKEAKKRKISNLKNPIMNKSKKRKVALNDDQDY